MPNPNIKEDWCQCTDPVKTKYQCPACGKPVLAFRKQVQATMKKLNQLVQTDGKIRE